MIAFICDAWNSQIHRDRKVEWWLPGAGGKRKQKVV